MAAPGNRIGKKEKNEDFYKAILLLKDEEECYSFFRDVCTIAELRAMEQRFEVARMLTQGKVYSEILERTGASQRDDLARGPLADRLRRRLRAHLRTHEGREVMESYSALAASYDELTQDVGYEKRAAFVEKLFLRSHIPVHTVLDLACGTGTMTALLTERGYELIGVDGSEDMLLEAREKAQTLTGVPPLFLHQSSPSWTSTARWRPRSAASTASITSPTRARCARPSAACTCSSRPAARSCSTFMPSASSRRWTVRSGSTNARTSTACGAQSIPAARACWTITLIFSPARADGAWERSFEEHRQRWYSVSELTEWLTAAGFGEIRVYGDCRLRAPNETDGRIYISCIRKE